MSFVCVVTPIIYSWAIFATAAELVAATLGFRIYTDSRIDQNTEALEGVEIAIDENREKEAGFLKKVLDKRGNFVLKKEDVAIYFEQDMIGHCKIRACGKNKTKEELRKAGREVFNRIMQEYAYTAIKEELKHKGFSVLNENTLEDGTIKIQVRKWA